MSSLSISIDPQPCTSAVAFPFLDLADLKLISGDDLSMLNCLYMLDVEVCSAIWLCNASASAMVLLLMLNRSVIFSEL